VGVRVLDVPTAVAVPEGWELGRDWWRARSDRLVARDPRYALWLGRVRVWGLWASLVWVLLLAASMPRYRQSLGVYAACFWILIVWFALARTKTITWAGLARLFSIGITWSWAIAWISTQLVHVTGLSVSDAGPGTAIAAFTEESLKLVPVIVLAVIAPGRVRRFGAVDWLLAGLACGLGFQVWEDLLRRLALSVTKPGILDFLTPRSGPGSGVPLYGWGPLSGGSGTWSGTDVYGFAGHHILTALITAGAGLGIAAWRHASRPLTAGGGSPEPVNSTPPNTSATVAVGPVGTSWPRGVWRVIAVLLPVLAWGLAVIDHFGGNAIGHDSTWLQAKHTSAPWPLRQVWAHTGEGTGIGWLLLAVLLACLLVDAARLHAAGRTTDLPDPTPADTTSGDAAGAGADGGWLFHPRTVIDRWTTAAVHTCGPRWQPLIGAGIALLVHTARDLSVTVIARTPTADTSDGGADVPGRASRAAISRGRAAMLLLQQIRTDAFTTLLPAPAANTADEPPPPPVLARPEQAARRRARLIAVAVLGVVLITGLVLAVLVAQQVGTTLTPGTGLFGWLAGQFDNLGQWWATLSPAQKIFAGLAIAALVALSGGSLTLAFGVSGALTYTAEHAQGATTLTRNPTAAIRSYLNTTTPLGAAADLGEFALTFAPGNFAGAAAGVGIRAGAGQFARDPDAWRAALQATRTRQLIDQGTVRFDQYGLKRAPNWPELLHDWHEGMKFNLAQAHRFEANEITLGNGKRLDSYTHEMAIVSRKNSQLADLEPSTAIQYLREHLTKYSPGEIISDTARAREHFPHLIGEELKGERVLEVPVQTRPVPPEILQYASDVKVSIHDITGKIYNLHPASKVAP